MKKILLSIVAFILILGVVAVVSIKNNESAKESTSKTDETITSTQDDSEKTDETSSSGDDLTVTNTGKITMSDGQEMSFELYGNLAPITVENFVKLANDGFYDGLIFHRVIEGFMIQGGDPLGTGTGGSDQKITGEFSQNGIENNLSHERGVMSMARSNDMDSASSQFFIMHQDSDFLDGAYAAFGKVTDGLDVVDQIATTETNSADKPLTDVVIESITID